MISPMSNETQTIHIEAGMDFERAERIILFLVERDFNVVARQETNRWVITANTNKEK